MLRTSAQDATPETTLCGMEETARLAAVSNAGVRRPGEDLRALLLPVLQHHFASTNVDLLAYVNDFLSHCETKSQGLIAAFADYVPETRTLVRRHAGGNCGSLSEVLCGQDFLEGEAYIVAADMPQAFRVPHIVRPGHIALLVPFCSPQDAPDRGVVLLESGFNFPTPLVLRDGQPVEFQHPGMGEMMRAEYDARRAHIVVARRPMTDTQPWNLDPDACFVFDTRRFINYHRVISKMMIPLQMTPRIISRDTQGVVTAMLVVNREKQQVEMMASTQRAEPVPFAQVDHQARWLATAPGGAEAFCGLLKHGVPGMAARVKQTISYADALNDLAAHLTQGRLSGPAS